METLAQSKSVVLREASLFKNRLQEYAQKAGIPLPIYHTTNEGTPHAPMFKSTVVINGATYTSPNVFSHRKSAEMDAARIALPSLPLQIDEENCSLELEDNFTYKSILNEYAVKIHAENLIYETKTSDGLSPAFSSVVLNGKQYVGDGGRNKKESQQLAARAAILSLLDSDERTVISKIITNKKKRLTAAKEKDRYPCDTQNEVMPVSKQTESNVSTSASKGNELKVVVLNENMPGASTIEHCTRNSSSVSAKPVPLHESRSPELEASLVEGLEANGSPIISVPPNSEQLIDSTSAEKRKRRSMKAKNKVGIDAQVQIAAVPSSVLLNDSMPRTTELTGNYTCVSEKHVPLHEFALPREEALLVMDNSSLKSRSAKKRKHMSTTAKKKTEIDAQLQIAAVPSSQTTIRIVPQAMPNNCVSLQGFENAVLSGSCVLPKGRSGSDTHFLVYWRKPPEGFIALNIRGALQNGIAAGGGVLRNYAGEHLSNFYNNYGSVSINFAESKAILDGLSVCKELGYNKIQIQTDSAQAALWFHRHSTLTVPLELQTIWNEIYRFQDMLSIEILHIYKEGNKLAEHISKKGILSEGTGSINISQETLARYHLTADKMGISYLRKLKN
ncbi:uncharacterized protein LOC141683980 isoform X2 [Apium graveolens]|uniref:uncharacterized protein LOC141683980 isoform X2 n=1 Tax=Apium graveolens TaxID=4045 RepID=UPI003D793235